MLSKYKTYLLLLALFFFCLEGTMKLAAQARLVMSGPYIVLSGGTSGKPIYIELNNSASNAITRTSGGIISEGEFNMVKWDIGAAAAGNTYVVPFYHYASSSYIPVTLNIATAGVGNGSIKFSTYHGSTATCNGGTLIADNYCYMPSDVTNMYPASSISTFPGSASTDDSYYVVDRFWIIDANTGYTTKPDPQLTFTYLNSTNSSTEVASPNAAGLDGTLIAQRFNSATSTWGDYLGPIGTTLVSGNTSTVTTNGVDITPAGFYRSWTLSDKNDVLPINLVSFIATCDGGNALLQWSSASEINNDHYTIDRSTDGKNFTTVTIVMGAGTSSIRHDYSFIDINPLPGTSYYRISQTDYDGNTTILNLIAFTECVAATNLITAYNASGVININVTADASDYYTFSLFNVLGQTILTESHSIASGDNEFKLYTNVSDGIYILNVKSGKVDYTKKMFIGK
jgi:hypothetical protein